MYFEEKDNGHEETEEHFWVFKRLIPSSASSSVLLFSDRVFVNLHDDLRDISVFVHFLIPTYYKARIVYVVIKTL